MNDYQELRYLRGNGTIDGLFDYLNFLESRINHKFEYNDEGIFFGESADDETSNYSGYTLFMVPEWLGMGKDIEEWLAYALSLEMTNYFINSKERIEKRDKRRAWLKGLQLSSDEKRIEANERDCLSLLKKKREETISFIRSMEEISNESNTPIGDLCANRIVSACERIKEEKKDDVREIDGRREKAESVINDMLNETIQHIKNKNINWQGLANELIQIVNETENKYNVPYMKALFEMAKMTEQERITRFGNIRGDNNSTKRSPIPVEIRREVWRRDQGQCAKCGSRQNLEYDHIVPLSKGGSNTARNIELLCQECNRRKSNSIS